MKLGLSGTTEKLYRRVGVSEPVADRLAVRAGMHPWEVWPEMAEHSMVEAEAAELERSRERGRRSMVRMRQDPEYRAREAEYQRTYRQSLSDAARRRERINANERMRRYRERKRAA